MSNAWGILNSGLAGFLFFGALMSYVNVMLGLKKLKPSNGSRLSTIRLPSFYRLDLICLCVFTFASGTALFDADRDWHDWWTTSLGGLGFVLVFSVWIVSRDASRTTKLEIRGRAAQHVKKGRKPEWLPMK